MTARIREIDVDALGPLVKIADGGQGVVYRWQGPPGGLVYKEYLPRVVDDLDVDALRAFVRFADELDEAVRGVLFSLVAWPVAVVRRDGVIRGFLMNQAPSRYSIEICSHGTASKELATAQFLLNSLEFQDNVGLRPVTDRFRVEFLADTANALTVLHWLNITVGDLSPTNLLFSVTDRPRCFFVDSDSMRLGEYSVLPPVETPDWRVGDIGAEELATRASDVYKFGLLAARLYAGNQNTTDPAEVPPRLHKRISRCLAADPRDRPPARAVLRTLRRELGHLLATPLLAQEAEQPLALVPIPRQAPQFPPAPVKKSDHERLPTMFWGSLFVVIAIVITIGSLVNRDGGSTALPRVPTRWSATPLPDYTTPPYTSNSNPTYNPSPSNSLPYDPNLIDRCFPGLDDGVHGGDGLNVARLEIWKLCYDAAVSEWPQLREHAPYGPVEVVGFFGESSTAPSATVDLSDRNGQCWRTNIGFDATYTVRSVSPWGPCG